MKYLLALFLFISFSVMGQSQKHCEARYDSLGIPHQEVKTLEGFYYCFGYHHAKDRAWEMDYFRRVGQGRNAEVLGLSQLKSDLMMRLLNLPALAEKIWKEVPEDKKRLLDFYAKGANAGFEIGKESHEFKDLGYEPEEWRPLDTLLVLLIQSFDQTRKTFFRDYEEQKAAEEWGEKAIELFNEDHLPWENTILKKGEYEVSEKKASNYTLPKGKVSLWAHFPTLFGEESGSNNWAVSSRKSKSGKAIIANDPHLDLKTPLFWYWIHLKSPDHELIGASLPGVPLVVSGTNGKVGWGLTNAYINTADAVFLKDVPEEVVETVRPLVWIKFGFLKLPFFFKSFERLKSGRPVLPMETKSEKKIALRWTGFSLTAKDVLPILEIMKAESISSMDTILKEVNVPAWNFVFADRKGEIGYRLIGRAFKHETQLPFGIPEMALEDFMKEEYLSPEERPHILRPERDYVYTANNRHWPGDSKFYGGRGYSYSFRGFRIDELLQNKHDTESFKSIQCDRQVTDARFFLPKILKYVDSEILKKWRLTANDDSSELSLYRRLLDIMMEKWKVNEYALFKLLDQLSDKQVLEAKAFYNQAVADVAGRGWGDFHRLGFSHLSKNESWVFSPEIPGIGDNHTVDPGTSKWNPDKKIYEQYSGASMRMIIEMHERPRIQLVLPGLNREYTVRGQRAPWQDWKDCKYSEVTF